MDAQQIKKRLMALESNRQVVEEQWDLIRKYVVPFRGQFFKDQTTESSVEWRENRDVFDSTAVNANNVLASSLHGAITNPQFPWFELTFRSDELNESKEALKWIHECAQITFQTIRDSNFNLEANEAYLDLTSFGTSFISKEVKEYDNGSFEDFVFQSIPVHESFFDQDHMGRVVNFYRKMKWSAVMVYEKFGEDTPNDIIEKAKKGDDGSMDIEVCFCIFRRDLGTKPDVTQVLSAENRPFGYKYILLKDCTEIGKEGGYYTMPAMAMRWRKTADSMWGNSPAMIALPDILTLNQLVELILNSLEKVVDPALKVTERGLLSSLDLGPAGVNVVRSMTDMEAFESKARFDVAELNRDKLQSSIRSIFYVDQLELKDSPAMTATEVQVRYELMQRLLGPTMGRLQSDFLDPMVMSTVADLMRYGKLPEPPAAVTEAGDPRMLVQYTGPMARAQRLDQIASMERFAGFVAQIGEVEPDVLAIPDWDQMIRIAARQHQVDPDSLKSKRQVKQDLSAKQDQQDRVTEAQIAQEEGRALQEMDGGQ